MPKIPEIAFEDVTIKEEYTGGYDRKRCISGLWGIYNVIKEIISANSDIKLLECLLTVGVNAKFEDENMTSLVYAGKTNKKYKRSMPAVKWEWTIASFIRNRGRRKGSRGIGASVFPSEDFCG